MRPTPIFEPLISRKPLSQNPTFVPDPKKPGEFKPFGLLDTVPKNKLLIIVGLLLVAAVAYYYLTTQTKGKKKKNIESQFEAYKKLLNRD